MMQTKCEPRFTRLEDDRLCPFNLENFAHSVNHDADNLPHSKISGAFFAYPKFMSILTLYYSTRR